MANLDFPDQLDLVAFISKEAHDLRSPFNRILGFTKMLLKGMDGPLTDMQREDLTTVLQNGLEATTLMSNLVDMARLSLGEKTVMLEQHEVNNLFGQAVAMWKQNHPGVEVTFDLQVIAPMVFIQTDEGLMRQMLVSWTSYVMEYIKTPENVSLRAEGVDGDVLFTVQCQGPRETAPSDCHLTMSGYIGQHLVTLLGGKMLGGEANEKGAWVKFSLPHVT